MNKREFVLASGGALVSGAGWAASAASASSTIDSTQSDAAVPAHGSLAHWQARVGERFELFGATPTTALVLQRVDLRESDARTTQFSLLFGHTGATPLAGTRVLRAASGGGLALHLAAAGPLADGGSSLRADFCQLV